MNFESIRDKLEDQEKHATQAHEQFTVDEHEEIAEAIPIYNEILSDIRTSLFTIQVLIDQAYEGVQTTLYSKPGCCQSQC